MNKYLMKIGEFDWKLKGVQSVLYCMRQTLDEGTDEIDTEAFSSVIYLLENITMDMITELNKEIDRDPGDAAPTV